MDWYSGYRPFQFTNYFLSCSYNYQLQVKIQIIQVISVNSLQKEFYVEDFLISIHSFDFQHFTPIAKLLI